MGQYFNDAVQSSEIGSQEVSNIKSQIQSIDLENNGLKDLSDLQSQLIDAALSIENEMISVEEKFSSGKNEIESLEQKVKKTRS